MIIRVERTGGFAGISESNELHCEDLPSELENTIKKIIKNTKTSSLPLKLSPKGAADHYAYKISIKNGVTNRTIECNQYDMQDDLKSLVRYVERNSKKN